MSADKKRVAIESGVRSQIMYEPMAKNSISERVQFTGVVESQPSPWEQVDACLVTAAPEKPALTPVVNDAVGAYPNGRTPRLILHSNR